MSVDRKPSIFKLYVSAGEPSGDLHAANVIRKISELMGGAFQCRGLGGPRMAAASCELDYQLTDLAVVGFVEVLPKLREFFRVADLASETFDTDRPDAVLLVDFPGFNWHIAKRAKQRGIPVFYYLPPQLWAWGAWRIRKMRRYVDHVLCNLPFEYEWYRRRGVSAEYVGHPFIEEVRDRKLDSRFVASHRNSDVCQIAVLPGSRTREVQNVWPMQLGIIRRLKQRHRQAKFSVACLRESHEVLCRRHMRESDKDLNLSFFVGRTSELIEIADCALMKSGSVSLEMAARGTPAVVVYQVSRTLYTVVRALTNISSMTLPNFIAGEVVMPEFLAIGKSTAKTVQQATTAMDALISRPEERKHQQRRLLAIADQLGDSQASGRAAASLLQRVAPESLPNTRAA